MKKNLTRTLLAGALVGLAIPGASAFDHLVIIGDATPGGWSISDGLMMVQDANNADVYHFMGWLEGNKNFKFTGDTNFNNSELELRNASSEPTDISKLVPANQTENDYQFHVTESANYDITVNVAELTVTAKKAEYQDAHIRYDVLYVIGSATPGNWELTDGTPLYAESNNPLILTGTVVLKADGDKNGEFKICANPWANWGGMWFHPYYTETDGELNADSIDYNKLTDNNSKDVKWEITPAEEGRYDLKLNLADMSFAKTYLGTTGVENVNISEENAVAAYYDLNGVRLQAPHKGSLCIEVRADGSARKIRF